MASVLRRYTPPTCTLEIAAKESALSRWTDRSVLKQLRFQLSFDDPRLPTERQVQIRGDRTQLEALHRAIEVYVQRVLEAAPAQLDSTLSRLPDATRQSEVAVNGEYSYPAAPPLTELTEALAHSNGHNSSFGIFLQPRGMLTHDLHLGALATEESGDVIQLSTLQLFDLANALDDYAAEALILPTLQRPAWLRSRPAWLQVAAVVVVTVGVTATVGKVAFDSSRPTTMASQQAATVDPSTTASAPTALPSPPADIPSVPPLIQGTPLPPPPIAGTATPPSGSALPPVNVPGTSSATNPPPRAATIPNLPRLAPIPPQPAPAPSPATIARAPQLEIPTPEESDPLSSARSGGGVGENDSAANATLQDGAGGAAAVQPPASTSTAFDAIPQVAEVRTYFQERWQPPESLTQTLEYRLLLNSDGTIQQVIPLGQAAGSYVDRTDMPLIGEPFVSPVESGQRVQIRLVLNPNGQVQTFLEQ